MEQKVYALDAFFFEKLKLSENDPTIVLKVPVIISDRFLINVWQFK